jgi:ATP-binding cassette, subfamily G (WHITE), member 2, PDR
MFVYRASPLTYFINGMVLAGLANTSIECSDTQLLHIEPRASSSNLSCGDYMEAFVETSGGLPRNPEATTDCLYCPVDQTNDLLQQLGMESEGAWVNAGYMVVYIIFNTLAVYAIYWLARVPKKRGLRA